MNLIKEIEDNLNPILLKAYEVKATKNVLQEYRELSNYSTKFTVPLRIKANSIKEFISNLEYILCCTLLGVSIKSDSSYKLSVSHDIEDELNTVNTSYINIDNVPSYEYALFAYNKADEVYKHNILYKKDLWFKEPRLSSFMVTVGEILINPIVEKDYISNNNYVNLSVNIIKPKEIFLQIEK